MQDILIQGAAAVTGIEFASGKKLVPGQTTTLVPIIEGDPQGLSYNFVWQKDGWSC